MCESHRLSQANTKLQTKTFLNQTLTEETTVNAGIQAPWKVEAYHPWRWIPAFLAGMTQ